MAETDPIARRSVPVPGSSCNVRLGQGAIAALGPAVKVAVSRPRRALLVTEEGTSPELVELVRRELSNVGFERVEREVPAGASARTLACVHGLFEELDAARITADDLMLAVGDVDALSACAYAAHAWCGGVRLAVVPTTLAAVIEPILSPRGLDLGASEQVIACEGHPRVMVCDLDWMPLSEGDGAALGRALMVATATGDGERSFGSLGERTAEVLAGDVQAVQDQLLETLRSRGRMASSNALAVRQSLLYGTTFARAIGRLVPELPEWARLSEGLRFTSRVAVGVPEGGDVELVFAQDALLDRLGLPEQAIEVDPSALVQALREECLRTSSRFMLALPQALGKVRLTLVPEELLEEHARAWCGARQALARARAAAE